MAELLKIARADFLPKPAEQLVAPDGASAVLNFRTVIEKTEEELECERLRGLTVRPYWDPALRRSQAWRLELYGVLQERGIICFRRRAKEGGFFC